MPGNAATSIFCCKYHVGLTAVNHKNNEFSANLCNATILGTEVADNETVNYECESDR